MHNDPYFTAVSRRTCCYDVQRRSLLGTKVRVHSDLVWCHESSVDSHLGHHFPPGKVTVEVTICELLCLDGLRHVISGILAGGIPGFRMVLLLLRSPSGMALWFWCSSLCFCCHTMSKWYNVITLALISPWTGTCHASVWLFCFGLLCFALFWWVCFWFLFLACGDFLTDYWTMRRSYTNSLLRPLNLQTAMYALIN